MLFSFYFMFRVMTQHNDIVVDHSKKTQVAILPVHKWADRATGIKELESIARQPKALAFLKNEK